MFCYQCEQTAKGNGCTAFGVCGKDPDTATLQDLLNYGVKGLSMYVLRLNRMNVKERKFDRLMIKCLFTTVTNVNFDPDRLEKMIRKLGRSMDEARQLYEKTCRARGEKPEELKGPAKWRPAKDRDGLILQGEDVSIEKRVEYIGSDLAGLQELIFYGLKGAAAYADHAAILGVEDEEVYENFHRILDYLAEDRPEQGRLLELAMESGKMNFQVMEMLDIAHNEKFGSPEPTQVRVEPIKGKAILVSGHDLLDLHELLIQTEGAGINVYTHGEMLPAHAYPELKKFKHLAGNYGGAWQDQRKEFDKFPGAILMTTNCIQKPKKSYEGRLFTSGLVAWPGVEHIEERNFKPVIKAAMEAEGFTRDGDDKKITVGFGHQAVLGVTERVVCRLPEKGQPLQCDKVSSGVADKVVDLVKKGAIKHFFLIGGCDGAKSGRNYYTEFAKSVPEDCVILTLACGKYRFNKMEFGSIDGIPRLLDVGQCNDAYSAIRIAMALAEAFDCGVNDLPLSLVLSWYEQKAVAILLSLLYLGVQDIRLGPTLPAFVTPAVLNILVEKFGIKPITAVEQDLRDILEPVEV